MPNDTTRAATPGLIPPGVWREDRHTKDGDDTIQIRDGEGKISLTVMGDDGEQAKAISAHLIALLNAAHAINPKNPMAVARGLDNLHAVLEICPNDNFTADRLRAFLYPHPAD